MTDISEITKYHSLKEIWVYTDQLLLDPRNPRINFGDSIEYLEEEIADENIQENIFHHINKKEHHIRDLIKNIQNTGFNSGIATFIVKELPGTKKFLVIEGNRRTTAIKQILLNKDGISDRVINTLTKIKVQRLDYISNPFFPEEQIIDIILGKIHLTGQLQWGAMEKAHYIYKTYSRELKKHMGSQYNGHYVYHQPSVKQTGDLFNLKSAEIKKNLAIYCAFSQLKSVGYKVNNDRYSLIDLAVNDNFINAEYFGVDKFNNFSEEGMDRFNTLCLEDCCPITNPKNLKDFITLYKEGEKKVISSIENGTVTVEEAFYEWKQKKYEVNFVKKLTEIRKKIGKLNVYEFLNSKEERRETKRIINLLNKKLIPLFKNGKPCKPTNDEINNTDWPSNISDAIGMNSEDLQDIIIDTLEECPNCSCTRNSLATKVLKYLEIKSHGEPREQFKDRIEKDLYKLINDGRIKPYRAKNDRLKVV